MEQKPSEDLRPMLSAIFTAGDVDSVRWTQYTPYFNDGDVCEFSANAVRMKIAGRSEEDDGECEDGYVSPWDIKVSGGDETRYERQEIPHGQRRNSWDTHRHVEVPTGRSFTPHASREALKELEAAVESGAFDDALYEAFGDHAEITVFRDRIEVESYEHD